MALTAKQERFVELVCEGETLADAYRGAYDCENMSDNSIYVEATRLSKNPKIATVLDSFRENARNKAQWNLDQSIERIVALNNEAFNHVVDGYISAGVRTTLLESTQLLNKLTGINKQLAKGEKTERVMIPEYDMSANVASNYNEVSRKINNGTAERIILKGGRGSAKSSYAYQKALDVFLSRPHAQWVCGRRYANTLRNSCFANVLWAINKRGMTVGKPGDGCDFNKTTSPMEITFNQTGQKILFFGLDEPEKLKSITFADPESKVEIFVLEEYNQLQSAESARNVRQSVFRGDYALEFDIFNPDPDERQWANVEAEIEEPKKLVHHSTYLTVPKEFIGQKFIEQAEILKQINPKAYENEYMGVVTGLEGRVFTNVEDYTLTQDDIDNIPWIRCGIDWGFSIDPWIFLRVGYDSKKQIVYIIAEDKGTNISDDEGVRRIKELLTQTDDEGNRYFQPKAPENIMYADSAEPKSIASYKQLGLNIHSVKKGKGSIRQGIKWLQSRSAIRIDKKRCPLAYQEFSRYTYERDKDNEITGGLPDRDNHTIDATRYALSPLIYSKKEV